MGKFGFGKKDKGTDNNTGEEDPHRSSLFGSRSSKSVTKGSASSNPYAQQQSGSDPYTQLDRKHGSGGVGENPYGNDKKYGGTNQPGTPYVGGATDGYGKSGLAGDSYDHNHAGEPSENRYGPGPGLATSDGKNTGGSRYGAGGYGGLGRTTSTDTSVIEGNRDALFGDAQNRHQQRTQQPPPAYQQAVGGGGDAYGDQSEPHGPSGGYGAYGADRQLTAEEEEEEDVAAAKQQIRQMKQEDVASTRNALRIAAQAEETGRGTLERLAAQGERIHNTEKNLDLANNHNRVAEERAKELKTLNKSMFAVHVSNPFTKADRHARRDNDVLAKHRVERDERDRTRAAAFASKTRIEGVIKDLQPGQAGYAEQRKSRLAERAKYQFEADSEDDAMEEEIDRNLDALGQAAVRLNAVARATGREVDEQNHQIDTIIGKVKSPILFSLLRFPFPPFCSWHETAFHRSGCHRTFE